MSAAKQRRRHRSGPPGAAQPGPGRPGRGRTGPSRPGAAPPGTAPPGTGPSPSAGRSLYTPAAGSRRRSLERASARPLLYVHQLPGWLPPLLMAALLVAGLALPGWAGAAVLGVPVIFLGWLAALSWPTLSPHSRLLRAAALGCVLALAVIQAIR
jgi:Family of unknown function (DUF6703)